MRPELTKAATLLRSDSPAAIEEVLGLLQQTVFSFSMKVCGHREDAEDTMQEVLLKSLPYLRKIESPEALAVWLYKVTRNRCWMSRRKSKFAPRQTLSLDELMPDGTELERLVQSPGPTPEQNVASKQEAERLHAAILRIPPQYRLVLVLHDMEELDTSQVARITGLREGTVRVRLHRARLFVRRELASPSHAKHSTRKRAPKPPECRQLFAGLSEFLDGRVDQLSCDRIQKHLEDCPPCIAFVRDLSSAIERCRNFETPCEPHTANAMRKLLMNEYLRLSHAGQVSASR